MSEEDETYTVSPADEALNCSLLTGHVIMRIQQFYAAGKIVGLETYNDLYEVARDANNAVSALRARLEKEQGS